MFDRIADRYDLINRIASFGIDRQWRGLAADALGLDSNARVLDLGTGTGDLMQSILVRYPDCRVVGLDPAAGMLGGARRKLHRKGLEPRADLVLGDAQQLPFPDRAFDAVSMGFGIRNVPDRSRALAEMARVTRDRGRIVILELTNPGSGLMGRLAGLHVHHVVPWLGSRLSGASEYRYLSESIAAFPSPERFAVQMNQAGLEVLRVQPLTFGVAAVFVARPRRSP
jgi:demethylmenaquinone methyltransferase/2-methoxy-6-polyprenyl-1,4-benzoquinol methylase